MIDGDQHHTAGRDRAASLRSASGKAESLAQDPAPGSRKAGEDSRILHELSARALLAERAARHAEPRRLGGRRQSAAAALQCVVGRERVALPVSDLLDVVRRDATFPVPNAPAHVPFAVAWRGEVLLVVAAAVLQGRPTPPPSPLQRIAVLRWRGGKAGLLVDEAPGVIPLVRAGLTPAREHAWLREGAAEGALACGTVVVDLAALAASLGER